MNAKIQAAKRSNAAFLANLTRTQVALKAAKSPKAKAALRDRANAIQARLADFAKQNSKLLRAAR